MKKTETLEYIKKERGFIPYVSLFDMFGNDDDIPQHLIDMSIKKDEKNHLIIGGEELINLINDIKKK